MRHVTGPTDSVVVIGAGLAGLSATLRLLASGRDVTLVEREPVPGGRAGVIRDRGYTFDTGPTVLTMPDLVADAFGCVGEDVDDWLHLRPLDPAYRAFYADGSTLDVRTDVASMTEEVHTFAGADAAAGYLRFVTYVRRLYELQMRQFIDRNLDSPFDLLVPELARLVAIGGFRRMAPVVRQYFADERLARIFSFQSMYAGLSPFEALALYCVIAYMDSVAGVSVPAGGMHALPRAMAAVADKHGAQVRYDCTVTSIERTGGRATAVLTADGDRIPADAVVVTADLPVAMRDLLGMQPRSVRRLRYSPSCHLLLVGSSASYSRTAHHNVHFGTQWRGVFDDLVRDGRLMRDPSFLVTDQSHGDATLAPPDRHAYYVFFPTPNAASGLDWQRIAPAHRDHMVRTLEQRGYVGFADAVEVEHAFTPLHWAKLGLAGGTPFAAAHTLLQTGPFRPRNIWGDNIVFAGSGTTPGVGVPMVLLSGRLAAQRITGLPQLRGGSG